MKKILWLGMLLFMCFTLLTSCSKKYNATLDSKANEWIDEAFLKENRVKGAYYYSDTGELYLSKTMPSTRTFIITEEDEFKKIFTKYNETIDFDKEMIVLYIFSDSSPRKYDLKSVSLKDQTMKVSYKLQYRSGNIKDSVMAYQRCFMLKLDKLDITTVEFIRKR